MAEKSKTQKKYNLSQLQAKLVLKEEDYPADPPTEAASDLEDELLRDTTKDTITKCWNLLGDNSDAVGWIFKALKKLGM